MASERGIDLSQVVGSGKEGRVMKEDLFRHIEGGKGESKQLVFLYMLSYSGTLLLWTLLGPGAVSCIERCPHFRNPLLWTPWDLVK